MELQVKQARITKRERARGLKQYYSHPRVYVFPQGESVLENLINRRQRPIKLFRHLANQALEQVGVKPLEMYWSPRAGCSCGCSPGFILRDWQAMEGHDHVRAFDVFVDVGAPE